MASITNEPNGRRTIQFVGIDGKRRSVRLGKVSKRVAETAKAQVEDLLACQRTGQPVTAETRRWLDSVGEELHARLAASGLVPKRVRPTLGAFIGSYTADRTDVKESTRTVWSRSTKHLLAFLGNDIALCDVTPADAARLRRYLDDRGLAEATARRTIGMAKQYFNAALKAKLITENPFADIPSAVPGNRARAYFVTRREVDALMAHSPDDQWRTLIALARYGAFRTPSESLLLRWGDVDLARSRVRVTSPKTEHHANGGERWLPLFPELLPHLGEVARADAADHDWVISRYRHSTVNLRTQLLRVMDRAGIKPWPRLWQNMRATRETELVEEFPAHVVSAWVGHSVAMAERHYLQVTDDHFKRAAADSQGEPAKQVGGGSEPEALSAVQKAVQHMQASGSVDSQRHPRQSASGAQNGDRHQDAACCEAKNLTEMGLTGFEPVTSPLSGVRSNQLSYRPRSPAPRVNAASPRA